MHANFKALDECEVHSYAVFSPFLPILIYKKPQETFRVVLETVLPGFIDNMWMGQRVVQSNLQITTLDYTTPWLYNTFPINQTF